MGIATSLSQLAQQEQISTLGVGGLKGPWSLSALLLLALVFDRRIAELDWEWRGIRNHDFKIELHGPLSVSHADLNLD